MKRCPPATSYKWLLANSMWRRGYRCIFHVGDEGSSPDWIIFLLIEK